MVPVANAFFLQGPDVYVLHNYHNLLIQGLFHILVEHVELRFQGELLPDGCLVDTVGVGQDHWGPIGFGGFTNGVADMVSASKMILPPLSVVCIDATL